MLVLAMEFSRGVRRPSSGLALRLETGGNESWTGRTEGCCSLKTEQKSVRLPSRTLPEAGAYARERVIEKPSSECIDWESSLK